MQEEGGRHTPFINGYRPQLFTRTADVTCTVTLPDGKMVMPGEDAKLTVNLITDLAIEVRITIFGSLCYPYCCFCILLLSISLP